MNVKIPPPVPVETVQKFQALASSGATQEDVIRAMREQHLHIVQSIKVASQIYHLSLTSAKDLVHNSETWADMREQYDALHDRLEQFAAVETRDAVKSDVGDGVTISAA